MALLYRWCVSFNPKLRYADVFPKELDFYLKSSGFNIVHKFGSFEEDDFCNDSENRYMFYQKNSLTKQQFLSTESGTIMEDYNKYNMSMNQTIDYKIRPLCQDESSLLKDFLYEAIFIPKGIEAPQERL